MSLGLKVIDADDEGLSPPTATPDESKSSTNGTLLVGIDVYSLSVRAFRFTRSFIE